MHFKREKYSISEFQLLTFDYFTTQIRLIGVKMYLYVSYFYKDSRNIKKGLSTYYTQVIVDFVKRC